MEKGEDVQEHRGMQRCGGGHRGGWCDLGGGDGEGAAAARVSASGCGCGIGTMVSVCVGFGTVVSGCVGSASMVGSGGVGERVRGEGCR